MARYALVIGISEYQSSNLSRLPKTVTDAEAVVQILKQYGDFQIVKRLPERWNQQNNDYEIGTKAVTGNELGQALRTFLLEQAYRSDALIYFSGHGITVSDNLGQTKGYLATSDCVLETDGKRIVGQQHGIALDSLNELIRAAELSSLVLLLDCCHGGYFLERQLVEQTLTAFSSQKDYYIITACRTFEQAWAMHDEKHDVFTGAVLDGLALENAGKDGSVSGDRLFDHISRQLKGKRQEPIRMGWGKSITVVNYPLNENTPSVTLTFNRENPYQGLQAFELGKEKYFFGRELAIRALLDRLNNARFLSVIGRSGCGKSSLVKAGLLPKLQSDRLPGSSQWEIEIFTPGIDPLGKLTEVLTRRHQENKPFVLFIDQFEEVFTLCNDEAKRQSFMRLMADEATASDRITRVIVAIRGDFLDRCAAYPEAVNLINRTQPTTYVVEPLSRQEIEETIEKPAELHGVGFEPGLVSQIAEDVENQPGALPLLQYALSELWRKFCEQGSPSGQPLLAWKDYEEIGGVKGALDNRATILYRSFIPENQAFVRRLFIRLVKLGDGNEVTRRRATWEELSAIADSDEQLQQVVRLLADQQQRLIITDENTIEVAHEALLSEWKLLRSWIEEDRDNIRLKQSLEDDCREWLERFNKSDDALVTGARLAAIEEWVNNTQFRLPTSESEFFQKSVKRRDREIQEKIEAAKREAEAEARAEAEKAKAAEAEARAEAEKAKAAEAIAIADIEKSLAAKDKAEAEARAADARAKVQKQRTRFAIAVGSLLTILAALFGVSATLQVAALNRQAEIEYQGKLDTQAILVETLNKNNDQLGALVASVRQLDMLKSKIVDIKYRKKVLPDIEKTVYSIRERNRLSEGKNTALIGLSLHPKGNVIAASGVDGLLRIWNTNGKPITELKFHTNRVRNIKFSPKGEFLASGGWDGYLNLWKVILNKKQWSYSTLIKNKGMVNDVIFSLKEEKLAVIINKSIIIANLNEINTVPQRTLIDKNALHPNNTIYSVSFNLQSSILAASFGDGSVRLWDLNTQEDDRPKILGDVDKSYTNYARVVKFSPKNNLLAFASEKGTIKLWRITSLSSMNPIGTIDAHQRPINSLDFNPDGDVIASASADGSIKLWDINKVIARGKPTQSSKDDLKDTLTGHTAPVNRLQFSPNGQTIVSSSDDGTVRVWQVASHIAYPSEINNEDSKINQLLGYSCNFLKDYLDNNKNSHHLSHIHETCKPYL